MLSLLYKASTTHCKNQLHIYKQKRRFCLYITDLSGIQICPFFHINTTINNAATAAVRTAERGSFRYQAKRELKISSKPCMAIIISFTLEIGFEKSTIDAHYFNASGFKENQILCIRSLAMK